MVLKPKESKLNKKSNGLLLPVVELTKTVVELGDVAAIGFWELRLMTRIPHPAYPGTCTP